MPRKVLPYDPLDVFETAAGKAALRSLATAPAKSIRRGGRLPRVRLVQVAVRVTPEVVAWLDAQADEERDERPDTNRSDIMRKIVIKAMREEMKAKKQSK